MNSSGVVVLCFILAALAPRAWTFLSVNEDVELIEKKCYQEGNLFKPNVPPPSLDVFLQIVEKLENRIGDASKVITTLLKRFSLQDFYVENGAIKQDHIKLNKYVNNKILRLTESIAFEPLPEGLLTDEEFCGLFAMLSHSWNGTALEVDSASRRHPDRVVRYFPAQKRYITTTMKSRSESTPIKSRGSSQPPTTPQMMMYGPRPHEQEKGSPREMGVIAIHPAISDEAVDIARVLLGIYYSTENGQPELNCEELLNRINQKSNDNPDPLADPDCNVLGLLTLGEALYRDTQVTGYPVRPNGEWKTDAGCRRHYYLSNYPEGSTMAQMKGALDGYILGSQLKNWNNPMSKHLLSKMLRMYYSLPDLKVPDAPSICNRDKLGDLDSTLNVNQVASFLKTFINVQERENPSTLFKDEKNKVESTAKQFMENFRDYIGQQLNAQCVANMASDTTTTPLDVVAVLMTPSHEHVPSIVSALASRLPLDPKGSSLSLLGVSTKSFRKMTIPSTAACAALNVETSGFENSTTDRVGVLTELQALLNQFHVESNSSLSRNGTVIIFFDFSETLHNGNSFNIQMENLRSYHPQAKFLSVGLNKEVVDAYVRLPKDGLVFGDTPINFVKNSLIKEVISSPAHFQVPTCRSTKPQNAGPLNLKMLPSRKQKWELSSEYFHKSKQPEVTFTIKSGSLKVCQGDVCPENVAAVDAYESKTKERQVSFNLTDPCKDYRDHRSCPNLKFVLESSRVASDSNIINSCFKENTKGAAECQTFIDVEYEVAFKGMQCGCGGIFCSPLVLLACLGTLIFWNFF